MRQAQWYQDQPHMTAPYSPCSSLLWPCSASSRSPVQRWSIGHRKTSQVSKWSGQQAEFIGTKISPKWLPYIGPIQASYIAPFKIPLQPLTGAPFKGWTSDHTETRQVSKWSACQDECSDTKINPIWLPCMGPIQAPYSPIQNPLIASLQPCSEEITSPYSITRYTKVFSSTSREQCTLWDLLSTANSPTNGTANNMFRVYVYWKIQKQ